MSFHETICDPVSTVGQAAREGLLPQLKQLIQEGEGLIYFVININTQGLFVVFPFNACTYFFFPFWAFRFESRQK